MNVACGSLSVHAFKRIIEVMKLIFGSHLSVGCIYAGREHLCDLSDRRANLSMELVCTYCCNNEVTIITSSWTYSIASQAILDEAATIEFLELNCPAYQDVYLLPHIS